MPDTAISHSSFALPKAAASARNAIMSTLAADDIQTRPGTHAVPGLGYYRQKYGIRIQIFRAPYSPKTGTVARPFAVGS